MTQSVDELVRGLLAGEIPALARALSRVERDADGGARLMAALAGARGAGHVLGVTGPPGAGKSTLVGALTRALLGLGHSVAVLAVDPSSPVSGGALLGDRFRIGEAIEGRCYVRSTASRGSLGGLTAAARHMVRLMDLAGFDLVIVETVGTGQSEIDVAHLADTLLVAFPPGLGDEMQAIKAGILELADILVVTKSDTPAASRAGDALRAVTHLWRRTPPLHQVSAVSGEGMSGLVADILDRAKGGFSSCRTFARREPEQRFASLWTAAEARFAELSALSAVAFREEGGLRVDIAPRALGDRFLIGLAAGAIAVLAPTEGLQCVDVQADPGGTVVILRLIAVDESG